MNRQIDKRLTFRIVRDGTGWAAGTTTLLAQVAFQRKCGKAASNGATVWAVTPGTFVDGNDGKFVVPSDDFALPVDITNERVVTYAED